MQQQAEQDTGTVELDIMGVKRGRGVEGYEIVTIETTRGRISARFYSSGAAAAGAAILVGGAAGGFDSPVNGMLYPELCCRLPASDIHCLWLRYRTPANLLESLLDVLVGVEFLASEGIARVGLAGWSFGGAVVVQAAALNSSVRTVVTLATQSHGLDPIAELGPRCSVLLLHGEADTVLPAEYSRAAFGHAREPKQLLIHPQSDHGLSQWGDEAVSIAAKWLREQIKRPDSEP